MAGEICPIFERTSDEEINLIGAWMLHPVNLDVIPDSYNFLEIGHIGPMLSKFVRNEPCREIPNRATEVGNGCKFLHGAFIMGHNHPSPNEPGGEPGVFYNYDMKQNDGVIILVRDKIDANDTVSESKSVPEKKWWQFWKITPENKSQATASVEVSDKVVPQTLILSFEGNLNQKERYIELIGSTGDAFVQCKTEKKSTATIIRGTDEADIAKGYLSREMRFPSIAVRNDFETYLQKEISRLGLSSCCSFYYEGSESQDTGTVKNIDTHAKELDKQIDSNSNKEKAAEYKDQGDKCYSNEQYDEAIDYYRRAIRIEPEKADAINNLGLALSAKGQTDEALDCYRKVIEINPGHIGTLINLGSLHFNNERYDEAIEFYDKAIETNPRHGAAYYNKALSLMQKERAEEAIQAYEVFFKYAGPQDEKRIRAAKYGIELAQSMLETQKLMEKIKRSQSKE